MRLVFPAFLLLVLMAWGCGQQPATKQQNGMINPTTSERLGSPGSLDVNLPSSTGESRATKVALTLLQPEDWTEGAASPRNFSAPAKGSVIERSVGEDGQALVAQTWQEYDGINSFYDFFHTWVTGLEGGIAYEFSVRCNNQSDTSFVACAAYEDTTSTNGEERFPLKKITNVLYVPPTDGFEEFSGSFRVPDSVGPSGIELFVAIFEKEMSFPATVLWESWQVRRLPDVSVKNGRPQYNVVLYLVDTLRADALHPYNDQWQSPNIQALAAESVLFENCYAAAPWTLPSVISLMTSTFPSEHGIVVDGNKVAEDKLLLAEALKTVGYHTLSIWHNPYAGPLTGLDRGFDRSKILQSYYGLRYPDLREPFFYYIHTLEPHAPYAPSRESLARTGEVSQGEQDRLNALLERHKELQHLDLEDAADKSDQVTELSETLTESIDEIRMLYQADVLDADAHIGEVIEALQSRGLWDRTLFILLSDHGEEFHERGGWQHDQSLYNELTHVPLIIHFPNGESKGKRIKQPVSLLDIAPTILAYIGLDSEAETWQGQNILGLLLSDNSSEQPQRIFSQRINVKRYYGPNKRDRGDINISILENPYKGIWNVEIDTFELYDIAQDPKERDDVSANHPDIVSSMKDALLEKFGVLKLENFQISWAKMREKLQEHPESVQALEALGYL